MIFNRMRCFCFKILVLLCVFRNKGILSIEQWLLSHVLAKKIGLLLYSPVQAGTKIEQRFSTSKEGIKYCTNVTLMICACVLAKVSDKHFLKS